MERSTTLKHSVQGALTLGLLLSALGACAHGTSEQLVDARRAYDDAKSSPARTRRPNELEAARVALQRAEDAHDDDPGSQREKRLATEAEHKAKIARAHGEEAAAEREAAQAEHAADVAHARADAAERVEERRTEHERETAVAPAHSSGGEVEARSPARETETRPARETKAERLRERKSAAALQNLASVASVREDARGVVITLSGSLLFPSGQQELSPIARQNLDRVAHALGEQPAGSKFLVSGHTDNTGTANQNKQLSTERARAVADQLAQAGIARDRIEVEGYGETRPIAGNDTPEGQASNRRVEILVEPGAKVAHR